MGGTYLVLSGGVGGSKLVQGLTQCLSPSQMITLVNTGDDFDHWGLRICPDIDTVTYMLAGVVDPVPGWGRHADTANVLSEMHALGEDTWFKLGDRDLALHLMRTNLLRSGLSLTDVTRHIHERFEIGHTVMPMCDAPIRTQLQTADGWLAFQDYFVRHRCEPAVTAIQYAGAEQALLPSVVSRLLESEALRGIVLAPSNPLLSIGPILAIRGLSEVLGAAGIPVVAVSPLIGGGATKGPAAKLLQQLGYSRGNAGLLEFYQGLIDILVLHELDRDEVLPHSDIKTVWTDTAMNDAAGRRRVAEFVLANI